MRLVEQHIIKSNNIHYKELIKRCKLSKNLYNATLYVIRQHFFESNKYLSYANIDKYFKESNNVDYRSLPIQTSQQTMRLVDYNFKSFFRLLKLKQSGKYNKPINIPKYLDKNGTYTLIFTAQQLGKKLQSGIIHIPLSNIEFYTNKTNIKQVRFIPKTNYIVMEVVYDVKEMDVKVDNGNYVGIDLGINNLATVVSNKMQSYIINGKPLKSINQYYNKKKALLQSKLINKRTSKRIQRLTFKRNCKIKDYFHKSTSYIVNQLVSNSINTVIIGQNKDWKQDINIGKINNQSFTSIPHSTFINMLKYKCRLNGINVICIEESYTSKASFLDNDIIPDFRAEGVSFSGNRINRGLYRSSNGRYINADINGAFNIIRKHTIKEVGNVVDLQPANRGFVFNPIRISF